MLAAELLSLFSFSASPLSLNEPPAPPLVSAFASAFVLAIAKAPPSPAPSLTHRNPREIYGSNILVAEKTKQNLENISGIWGIAVEDWGSEITGERQIPELRAPELEFAAGEGGEGGEGRGNTRGFPLVLGVGFSCVPFSFSL